MTVRTLCLLLLALLAPATAQAATTVKAAGGTTVLVTGDERDNTIRIAEEAEYVVISEEGAAVVYDDTGPECEQDGQRVRCGTAGELKVMNVDGVAGKDVLTADTDVIAIFLHGGAGDDTLNSSSNGLATEMSGGDGSDTLNARAGYIDRHDQGGIGNDTLNGNPEDFDDFLQEPGSDTYSGGTPSPASPACLGERCLDLDRIRYLTGPVTVTLDGVADDGAAGEADNVRPDVDGIIGSRENDTLDATGAPGDHRFDGDAGDDTLWGGPGRDILHGGLGGDVLSGLGGDDELNSGGEEHEAPAADRLDGGDGDDTLVGGFGPEELIGGAGMDGAHFHRSLNQADVGFEILLDDQPNDGPRGAGEGDNVRSDVEIVETSSGDDRIIGSAGPEQLSGGSGNDEIDGRGGVDLIRGEAGADTLVSRDLGFDLVNCGEGADATVQADEGDRLDNCEASALTPLPPPPDTVKPQLTLGGATSISARTFARRRTITVTARTNESTVLAGRATVKGMLARAGDYVLAERALPLAGPGARKLRMKVSRRDARAIRRKLRKRAYRLTVRVTATDPSGNHASVTRRITIRKR